MNIFHLGKGKVTTLHELFLDQLRDLYSAETQLTKVLPEMAEAANDVSPPGGLSKEVGHLFRARRGALR